MYWKKKIKSILVYTKNLLTIVKKKLQIDTAPCIMKIIKLAIITNFFANLTMVMPTHSKAAYLALWKYWKIKLFLLQHCDLFLLERRASGTKTTVCYTRMATLLHTLELQYHANL